MRSVVSLLVLFAGCGAPASQAAEPQEVEIPVGPVQVDPLTLVVQEAADTRDSLDVLRCFLAHSREKSDGKAPEGWVQPSMEEYEEVEDPCSLLPGYVDPQAEERKRLEELQRQVEEQRKLQEQQQQAVDLVDTK